MVDDPLPDEIQITMVKDVVPNFITARATVSRLQAQENKRAERTGEPPRRVIYCQFCGSKQRSMQALRAHLRFCKGKYAVRRAATDGVTFDVGTRSFTVCARSLKLYAGLEKYERQLNMWVSEGKWEHNSAERVFYAMVLGAAMTEPEGWVKLTITEVNDGE